MRHTLSWPRLSPNVKWKMENGKKMRKEKGNSESFWIDSLVHCTVIQREGFARAPSCQRRRSPPWRTPPAAGRVAPAGGRGAGRRGAVPRARRQDYQPRPRMSLRRGRVCNRGSVVSKQLLPPPSLVCRWDCEGCMLRADALPLPTVWQAAPPPEIEPHWPYGARTQHACTPQRRGRITAARPASRPPAPRGWSPPRR